MSLDRHREGSLQYRVERWLASTKSAHGSTSQPISQRRIILSAQDETDHSCTPKSSPLPRPKKKRTRTDISQLLPVEILSHIFRYCLPDGFNFTHHQPLSHRVLEICHFWREVALATPHLYNTMHLLDDCNMLARNPGEVDYSRWTDSWFSAAKTIQQDIVVHEGFDFEDLWRPLARHCSNWKTLTFTRMPGYDGILSFWSFAGDCDNLVNLSIGVAEQYHCPDGVFQCFPTVLFPRLQRLEIEGLYLSILQVIAAPELRHLGIYFVFDHPVYLIKSSLAAMPKLSSLELQAVDIDTKQLFIPIRSNLTNLVWYPQRWLDEGYDDAPDLAPIEILDKLKHLEIAYKDFKSSANMKFNHLSRLVLELTEDLVDNVFSFLSRFPNLQYLVIKSPDNEHIHVDARNLNIALRVTECSGRALALCPRLKEILYQNVHVDSRSLFEMARVRGKQKIRITTRSCCDVADMELADLPTLFKNLDA